MEPTPETNTALYYAVPLLKNLAILCLTPWLLMLAGAIKKAGIEGFSFMHWLRNNQQRFLLGFIFVLSLSTLMALTDVAPLFKVFGFDIDASPVGLGLSIGALLIAGISSSETMAGKKAEAAKEIQKDAQNIIATSADIVKDEKGDR